MLDDNESGAPTVQATADPATTSPEFTLSASESELLEEFGVLLAAEYNYTAF